MKKILPFLFLGLLICSNGFTQKYYKQQFTLFKFHCVVDSRVISQLSEIESCMDCKPPKSYSKTEVMFVQSIFTVVKSKLESKFGVYILPIESYGDKADYDDFGFPDIMINNAIKKGTTKYFFKVTAYIQNSNKLDATNTSDFRPVVKVQIDLFNKSGYQPISTVEGVSEAVGMMKREPSILTGLDCVTVPKDKKAAVDAEVILTLINDAVDQALKSL
jgi:hypothetical protein